MAGAHPETRERRNPRLPSQSPAAVALCQAQTLSYCAAAMEPSARGAAGAFPERRLKGVPGPPPWAGGWGPQKSHVPKATRLSLIVKQKDPPDRRPCFIHLHLSHPPTSPSPLPFPPNALPPPFLALSIHDFFPFNHCLTVFHPCPEVPGPRSLRQIHRQAAVGPTPASCPVSL